MADELVDRLAILVAFRRFHGMGAVDSRYLRLTIMSVCNISFVELLTTYVPFRRFWGDVR
jgi:hypothetical protein